jgi:hypothetical protein
MRKIFSLSLLLICFSSLSLRAQTAFATQTWFGIDSALYTKTNLIDLLATVQNLKTKAIAEKRNLLVARCLNYEMQIADKKTEDSLYFKNSAFIDEMLRQQQPKELQFALELMQAARLKRFITGYHKFQINRYERRDVIINYAAMADSTIDSLSQQHFEKAKILAKEIAVQNIDDALWLSADPLQFLFKPTLFDIAIAEQLNAVKAKFYYQFKLAKQFVQWLPLSPDAFISKLDSVNQQSDKGNKDFKLYQEWLQYHINNSANYYFIESLMRKYAYDNVQTQNKESEIAYEKYLELQTQSAYTAVKAYCVYQLCILWNSQANKYFPSFRYSYTSDDNYKVYNTSVRYHAVKAMQLFNNNKPLLDSFSYLKNILSIMELKIKSTDLEISIPENNLPYKPILAELKFKNTDTLFYTVVKTENQYPVSGKRLNDFVNSLLKKTVQKQGIINLPKVNDYNYHNTFITMDELASGQYAIVFSHQPLTDTSVKRNYIFFRVTNIAVVNNDKRIYILNRTTGQPLEGAEVNSSYTATVKKDSVTIIKEYEKKWKVNKQGFIEINNDQYSTLQIQYGNDTISEYVNYKEYDTPEDVYTKDEFDDLIEFYGENATAYIYTDRSIYRPGQTVFYKAIFITKNKNTGEPMLMNKKNLKGKLFSNVYKEFLKVEGPVLEISDPFGKIMDSLKIIPNEFGSVYGSYKIPKTAATGEWDIEPDYIDVDNHGGSFKVEEYKRPTYELDIIKPLKEIKPGDSFTAAVKVKSFAGAALSNVRIQYNVTAYANYNQRDSVTHLPVSKSDSYSYADTTGFTNSDGELKIFIHDTALLKKLTTMEDGWRVSYDIKAEATDATGESYKKDIYINVISRPVNIKIPLAAKYNRSEMSPVTVSTSDNNAGPVDKTVAVKIYRVVSNKKLYSDRKLTAADIWLFNQQELQKIFPEYDLANEKDSLTEQLISEKIINTANKEKLELDTALLQPGVYKLMALCTENNIIKGELIKNFTVFDTKTGALPEPDIDYTYLPFTSGAPGDKMKYYYGNSESGVYAVFHVAYLSAAKTKFYYEEEQARKGVQEFNFTIPQNATGQLKLTNFYIYNNQLFTNTQTIYIAEPVATVPEIIIEKYRKKLQPGSTETFSVSIKTKNENVAAELMTTMYDASLDKIVDYDKHVWRKPDDYQRRQYISLDWTRTINNTIKNTDQLYFNNDQRNNSVWADSKTTPLWWLNPLDYAYDELLSYSTSRNSSGNSFQHDMNPDIRYTFNTGTSNLYSGGSYGAGSMLQGRLAGVSLTSTQGLNEVVVVGYGTSSRKDITGSVSSASIRIRGANSISDYTQLMIVLDGVVYTGDLSKVNTGSITAAMVLKGADAIALFGSNAANGVLILSTKGEIVLPKEPEPQIIPRKNFNETAFFFPAIHADRDGYYSFSFTMPETVTEWNWKLMAHTKKGIFAYTEKKLNTQLPLMVQPNMPRLLYQGDKIVLQSRITNLDSTDASGKIVCKIEDAVTGDDITAQLTGTQQNNFSVLAKSNIAAAFTLTVPQAQIHPLKISITVRSQSFADGEEYIIPVLSPKVFVRAATSFSFTAADTSIALSALPADADPFGIGVSVQAKPQAALLNSLPALANYPYNCAEQTFNKLLAYTTAYKLMRTDTVTQRSYTAAKQFVEKESSKEKLPDELAEETMPWLNLGNRTAIQQKQLFNLLDTSQSAIAVEALMNRLKKLQNADGGISWFDGGSSDRYMSQYILRGLGKLAADKQLLPQKTFDYMNYTVFVNKLVNYCDANFVNSIHTNKWYNGLYYAYCRSYVLNSYPLSDSIRLLVKNMLQQQRITAYSTTLHTALLITLCSFKYADGEQDSLNISAAADLRSLEQLAIDDGQNGLRWKEIADADDLNFSAEETIGLLSEVFTGYGKNAAISKGILSWLMNAKNEHQWTNTKATAAAINLLLTENNSVNGSTQSVKIKVDKNQLSVSNDLLNGNTFDYAATATKPTSLQLQNQGSTAVSGNLYRYYFTAAENAAALNNEVQLSKQLYRWNNNAWELLLPNSTLRIADKVKVVLTVQTSKPLQYVFINDKRSAAFEPLDNSSGYRYNDGVHYYRSVRDAGYQFFADFIPSGKHTIEYEVKLAQEGSFTNGIAVLQCMYRPDITAYSNGLKIVCEK